MSLLELGPVIFGSTEDLVAWLRSKRRSQDCSACNVSMRHGRRSDVTDGLVWRCPQCKTTRSIREGSFFTKSRLSLQKWTILLLYWARQFPVKDAGQDAEVHKNTACDVYRWLREICSTKLLQSPIILGGPGIIVQIDESLFRHKVKVNTHTHTHTHK